MSNQTPTTQGRELSMKDRAAVFIVQVADIIGEVSYQRSYADGHWGLSVDRYATVTATGYAIDTYGNVLSTPLAALSWAELGSLLECCATYGYQF